MAMYDVAVIGGGVIGCAVLHELTHQGYHCVLLEKKHLVSGTSSGNSGMAHTGFDAGLETLEGRFVRNASQHLNWKLYRALGIPYQQIGAVMVAWSKAELDQLPEIVKHAHSVGVTDVCQMSREQVLSLEPELSRDALGGVWIPGEALVDPFLTPVTLAHVAQRAGALVQCQTEVMSVEQMVGGTWRLVTSQGPIIARAIVNAAGLFGDRIENMCHQSKFRISPLKGQYVVFGQETGHLIKHIILPVPNKLTKGVIVFPTVYKNVIVGPTAENVDDREDHTTDSEVINKLASFARKVIPALSQFEPIGSYAGLRPATQQRDYHLYADAKRNWVTAGGIRSTGVSACLAIAKQVQKMLKEQLNLKPSRPAPNPKNKGTPVWMKSEKCGIVMDGTEYPVTHPITKYGLWKKSSKL